MLSEKDGSARRPIALVHFALFFGVTTGGLLLTDAWKRHVAGSWEDLWTQYGHRGGQEGAWTNEVLQIEFPALLVNSLTL